MVNAVHLTVTEHTVSVLCVSLSVCLLVTTVSCAETAEQIEIPFGVWTWVGPRNHVSGGPRIHGMGRAIYGEAFPGPL